MFKTRLLSGILLVILIVAVLYCGGYVTAGAMLFVSLVGVFELLRVYGIEKKPIGFVAYIATAAHYAVLMLGREDLILPVALGMLLLVLAVYVITYPTYTDKDALASVFAFFYAGMLLSYIYLIRKMPDGGALVVMVFVCSWVNDTLAYCAGVTLGKHKMSPKLSPKKSVEGLIGGLLGSTIVGALYGVFFNAYVTELSLAPVIFGAAGLLGAAVAVIGDLAASAIKRNNDIKDYGKLIPGHGGVLDRFDSILFTAPIVYYTFLYTIGHLGG